MFIALVALGSLLIIFGAVVLLRYSDRPGGTVKWFGLEVSSAGAGLPLVALGVGCILFAAVRSSPDGRTQGPPAGETSAPGTPAAAVRAGGSGSPAFDLPCMEEVLAGVESDRITRVEVGMRDLVVIGTHQPLELPFALLLTEEGQPIGAMRVRLYRASHSGSDLYRIEAAVDAECDSVSDIRNASRGGNPRELTNWDTARLALGDSYYELRIGGEGDITIGRFYKVQ